VGKLPILLFWRRFFLLPFLPGSPLGPVWPARVSPAPSQVLLGVSEAASRPPRNSFGWSSEALGGSGGLIWGTRGPFGGSPEAIFDVHNAPLVLLEIKSHALGPSGESPESHSPRDPRVTVSRSTKFVCENAIRVWLVMTVRMAVFYCAYRIAHTRGTFAAHHRTPDAHTRGASHAPALVGSFVAHLGHAPPTC